MVRIGFHASHEQFPASRLLECLKRAEAAGFEAAMCSDHFHPWSERQAQSGFAWSWLGAALQATGLTLGTVCAPGQRYHPAIIAQAAATLAEMYPGRFWVALGSGENLNEHITGEAWPEKELRDRRLGECVEVIRALWRGATVTHCGAVRVERARLYTRPPRPPLLIGAAITEETARWVATWADGLVTVGKELDSLRRVVAAFRASGGEGKPIYLQAGLSYAPTKSEAAFEAHHQWRHCVLDGERFADIAMPCDFDTECEHASPDEVCQRLHVSADLGYHADWISAAAAIGFDAIYLNHIGRDIERFIDVFGEHVLPKLPR
jgi:coenzyme F420-dependent glucose-6-phosphate dehydrogenase